MFATAEAFQQIIVRLSVLRYVITSNTRRGKDDVATDAEDFFAGFFNILMGWKLQNANSTRRNCPAIDLEDSRARIAIQITAQNSLKKIRDTVDSFYKHDMRRSYDSLIILILSNRLQAVEEFNELKRDLKNFNVWDLDDVFALVEQNVKWSDVSDDGEPLIAQLDEYTRIQLPSIIRALSHDTQKDVRQRTSGLLRRLEVTSGRGPLNARFFLGSVAPWINEHDAHSSLKEISDFHLQLQNESSLTSRSILAHAIRFSIPGTLFKARFPDYSESYIDEKTLIYDPESVANGLTFHDKMQYRNYVKGMQFCGWGDPLDNSRFFSLGYPLRALDTNFFFLLKSFVRNDHDKLRSILVDLDFRLLDER